MKLNKHLSKTAKRTEAETYIYTKTNAFTLKQILLYPVQLCFFVRLDELIIS